LQAGSRHSLQSPISRKQCFDSRNRAKDESRDGDLDLAVCKALVRLLAASNRGGVLLDVGCGASRFPEVASALFTVVAFDVSLKAVTMVRGNLAGKYVGTATAIPLRGNCVDMVTCLDVIEHLPNPEVYFQEAHRVLRSGGYLFVRTPNPDSLGLTLKREKWFGFRDPTHVMLKSIGFWKQRLERGGFRLVETGTDLFWDPPYFSESSNLFEKIVFIGTDLMVKLVKPYLPWNGGENAHLLAQKG